MGYAETMLDGICCDRGFPMEEWELSIEEISRTLMFLYLLDPTAKCWRGFIDDTASGEEVDIERMQDEADELIKQPVADTIRSARMDLERHTMAPVE